MTTSLCFNDFTFSPVPRNNQPWFRSSEIATALGYAREDTLSRLYDRNADEFTSEMTQVVEISVDRQFGVEGRARIFSLRGCYALAMFARTPIAKAFRKWCLDVIEQYGDRVPLNAPLPSPLPRLTTESPCGIWSTSGQGSRECTLPTCGRRCAPASSLAASTTCPPIGSPTPSHGCKAKLTN